MFFCYFVYVFCYCSLVVILQHPVAAVIAFFAATTSSVVLSVHTADARGSHTASLCSFCLALRLTANGTARTPQILGCTCTTATSCTSNSWGASATCRQIACICWTILTSAVLGSNLSCPITPLANTSTWRDRLVNCYQSVA